MADSWKDRMESVRNIQDEISLMDRGQKEIFLKYLNLCKQKPYPYFPDFIGSDQFEFVVDEVRDLDPETVQGIAIFIRDEIQAFYDESDLHSQIKRNSIRRN
jgi:hypothetical protein